jgi:uncharacterized protein (DUF362 family)
MISRRTMIVSGAAGICGSGAATLKQHRRPLPPARVAAFKAHSYSADFESIVVQGLEACGIALRGKVALVKPNLVEYVAGQPVHTHSSVLAGTIAALARQGAHVIVGEGPGHRRDTLDMARAAGYAEAVPDLERQFVDLNLDDVRQAGDMAGGPLYLSATALSADVIVSVAKMKTHHWAGATLSMKNLFGVVPGAVYGWPKNHLHFRGIEETIAALYRRFPRTIGIVDGVVAMEGNGPIQGRAIPAGVVVVGSDLAAVDATCCRIMGIDPAHIGYLNKVDGARIHLDETAQRGENLSVLTRPFDLPPRLSHLRA